jgi:hypothetical protein
MNAILQCVDHALTQSVVSDETEAITRDVDMLDAVVEERLDQLFASILELQMNIKYLRGELGRVERVVEQREALLRRTLTRKMKLRAELLGQSQL